MGYCVGELDIFTSLKNEPKDPQAKKKKKIKVKECLYPLGIFLFQCFPSFSKATRNYLRISQSDKAGLSPQLRCALRKNKQNQTKTQQNNKTNQPTNKQTTALN